MGSIKRILIQFLVRKLLAAITEEDILQRTNRGWFTNYRKLAPEEVEQLKMEAKYLKHSLIWKYMRNELRYLANLRMFEQGINAENTIFGRAMLYDLQLIEEYIKSCRKI